MIISKAHLLSRLLNKDEHDSTEKLGNHQWLLQLDNLADYNNFWGYAETSLEVIEVI